MSKTVIEKFEASLNCNIEETLFDNLGNLLNSTDSFDLVFGVDKSFLQQAISSKKFSRYTSEEAKNIKKDIQFNKSFYFTPIGYSYVCFVYDTQQLQNPPKTLGDLQNEKYLNQIILFDPQKLSIGRMFYVKSISRFTVAGHRQFFRSLRKNFRAILTNLEDGYNMVLARESIFMVGTNTYQYYDERMLPCLVDKFSVKNILGVGIYENSKKRALSEKFIDYLLSEENQKILMKELFVYPVRKNIVLPEKFPVEIVSYIDNDALNLGYIEWRAERYVNDNDYILYKDRK